MADEGFSVVVIIVTRFGCFNFLLQGAWVGEGWCKEDSSVVIGENGAIV